VFSHGFSQDTHADGSKEVDAETRVARIVDGEDAAKRRHYGIVFHPLRQLLHAHALSELFDQDLDEDT